MAFDLSSGNDLQDDINAQAFTARPAALVLPGRRGRLPVSSFPKQTQLRLRVLLRLLRR